MNSHFQKPHLFSYIDLTGYLSDYYSFRKKNGSGFSYEHWANELGVKSRSLLRMIVLGRRVASPVFIEKLTYQLKLSSKEIKYIRLMAEHQKAKTKEQKQFFWKQMLAIIVEENERTEITDIDRFFSSHWLPKIQVILTFTDIDWTTKNISDFFHIEYSLTEELMKELQDLNLAQQIGEIWQSNVSSFKTPPSYNNQALKNYYIRSFDDAKKAIDLHPALRQFRSLLIPINANEYQQILQELENLFQEILLKYKTDHISGRSLYQMNFNLFPIKLDEVQSKQEIKIDS